MVQYFSTILNDSPFAYWRLDELFTSPVRDDSPQANDGTLNGSITIHAPGAINPSHSNSMFFGGNDAGTSGGYISIPSALTTAGWGTISVECWFNLVDSTFTSFPRLLSNSVSNTDHNGFDLLLLPHGTNAYFYVGNGTTSANGATVGTFSPNVWYYLAAVYDGAHIQMYVNGVANGPAVAMTGALSASGNPVNIARNPVHAGDYFPGNLDEVAIYQYALTPAQVLAHYKAGINNAAGPWQVTISRAPVKTVAGSLSVDTAIGRTGIASFTVKQPNTNTHYQQYQPVAIYDQDSVLYYSGYINLPKEQKPGFLNTLLTYITCMDQRWLADKRVVFDTGTNLAKTYTGKGYDFIVADIANTILNQEGVTIGSIYGLAPSTSLAPSTTLAPLGPTAIIPLATLNFPTVSQVYDALTKASATTGITFYWYIDQYKRLYFQIYNATTALAVDGTTIDQAGRKPPYVQRANPLYFNTQYIVGGTDGTAQQTFGFVGDGTSTSWTLPLGPVNKAPFVWINGTAQSVGILNVDAGKQFYWSPGSATLSAATAPANTAQGFVWYQPQVPTNADVSNSTEITNQAAIDGTSGKVESVVKDTTIAKFSDGLAEANANLARNAQRGVKFVYTTRDTGHVPGQYRLYTYAPLNFSATGLLTESVHVDDADGLNYWFTVTAVAGPVDSTWVEFFGGSLLPPSQQSQSLSIGV